MERRRIKHTASLEERISEHARLARDRAKKLPPCQEREELLRKARQGETARKMIEWLQSPTVSKAPVMSND
jgi:hypothetical protein